MIKYAPSQNFNLRTVTIEAKPIRYLRGKWGRRTITFELHPTDITPDLDEKLYEFADEALPGKLVYQPSSEEEQEEVKKSSSIYQKFMFACQELGIDYEKEKANIAKEKKIKIVHMKDLETIMTIPKIEAFLNDRLWRLKQELGLLN